MVYSTHKNHICPFFFKNFITPEVVKNELDDLELPEIISDDDAQGTSADAHVEPNRRISTQQLIYPADMEPVLNSNTSLVNNSDHGVIDSETTIISKLDQLVLTTMAKNVWMKYLKK